MNKFQPCPICKLILPRYLLVRTEVTATIQGQIQKKTILTCKICNVRVKKAIEESQKEQKPEENKDE